MPILYILRCDLDAFRYIGCIFTCVCDRALCHILIYWNWLQNLNAINFSIVRMDVKFSIFAWKQKKRTGHYRPRLVAIIFFCICSIFLLLVRLFFCFSAPFCLSLSPVVIFNIKNSDFSIWLYQNHCFESHCSLTNA